MGVTIPQSGVGVLDRSMAILAAVEGGAGSLAEITSATGLSRATAHRLATALETHGLLARVAAGRWRLGLRLLSLGSAAAARVSIRDAARPALHHLSETTGESVQLYVRLGDARVCLEAVESPRELRTIVPVGAALPLTAGSAGKVFLAWAEAEEQDRLLAHLPRLTPDTLDASRLRAELPRVRERGWAESIGEREAGVASVSAPVLDAAGRIVAAVSVSGPVGRTGRSPGRRYSREAVAAARAIEAAAGTGTA